MHSNPIHEPLDPYNTFARSQHAKYVPLNNLKYEQIEPY
jgi:hypothetical protein